MRIAHSSRSATEIVLHWDLPKTLVGVTFECDFPPDPRPDARSWSAGWTRTASLQGRSMRSLGEKIAAGHDLYRLDEERFRTSDPTHVLTQDLCRVCALPADEADSALARLGCDADVVTLDPHTLDEVLATIIDAGSSLGVPDRAATVVEQLRERIAVVTARVSSRDRPNVFVLEWVRSPVPLGPLGARPRDGSRR